MSDDYGTFSASGEEAGAFAAAGEAVERGEAGKLADAILAALTGSDSMARERTLERLRRWSGGPALLPHLLAALGEGRNAGRRNAARSALAALASPGSVEDAAAVQATEGVLLESTDEDVRVLAATALGESGSPRAIGGLSSALHDPDSNVRSAAAEALGLLGDGRAIPALRGAIEENDRWTATAAALAIGRIGDSRGLEPLARALGDPWLASTAIEAVGMLGDPQGLPLLRDVADSGSSTVRRAVVRAACTLLSRNPEVEPPDWLRRFVAEQDEELIASFRETGDASAARMLGIAGTPAAAEALLGDIGEAGAREGVAAGVGWLPEEVAAEAILAHLEEADPEIQPLLLALLPPLRTPQRIGRVRPFLASDDAEVRATAAAILSRSPPELADPVLREVAGDPASHAGGALALAELPTVDEATLLSLLDDASPEVRRAAAESLGGRQPVAHLDRIRERMTAEPDPAVREVLARALGRAGGERAVQLLTEDAEHEDAHTRFAALRGLAETAHPAALPLLVAGLEDPAPEVQAAALRGLANLGDPSAGESVAARLDTGDRDLRREAALALQALATPPLVGRLLQALSDPDAEIRLAAVRTLERLGPDAPGEALSRVRDSDPDPGVRRAAERALDPPGTES
jgi:HEAT repeat protein